ncbi:MAG: deoxyguanosinetriphosphate triphosphohydrolase, partial [Rubrivivax sp.]|nr:deoxyguanosinetriphosphate triphosphohydrolase [Rubrivivax sp.]
MTIRERIEAAEASQLSEFAALAARSRGRREPEPPDATRTCYMRDRDRIIHRAKAFRRLAHKTQVFISPLDDHVRTRLSHTLEVSQIARTISRALRLNDDLTEAIALAHDLGHAPFGHAGEEGLDEALRGHGFESGFHHAIHSLRVVDQLEREGRGLNLTWEVRNGIVAHTKGRANLADEVADRPATLEAQVVRFSDRIAYLNHDIDDAVRAGVLRVQDLPADALAALGTTHGQRISRMVEDVISNSLDRPAVTMSAEVAAAADVIKEFMFTEVYLNTAAANAHRARIKAMVGALWAHYLEHAEAVPHPHPSLDLSRRTDRATAACDYVAGMTDR